MREAAVNWGYSRTDKVWTSTEFGEGSVPDVMVKFIAECGRVYSGSKFVFPTSGDVFEYLWSNWHGNLPEEYVQKHLNWLVRDGYLRCVRVG